MVTRAVNGWVAAYRADLLADAADLREPLDVLQATLADDGDAPTLPQLLARGVSASDTADMLNLAASAMRTIPAPARVRNLAVQRAFQADQAGWADF